MGLRTALFFAHECAPHNHARSTMGAQRPAQFARHLPEFGWRALVVCCEASRRHSARRSDRAAVEAEVARYWDAADPARSLVVPTPSLDSDGAIDAAWHRLGEGGSALARRALTLAKYATGDQSQSWQPCARWAAEVLAREVPIDVCIGEHGPDAGLFLARWFHDTHDVPWVADFRDPILRPYEGWRRRLYKPIARRLVASAEHVVNVTPTWSASDRELFGRPATCIPNGFDPAEYPAQEPDPIFTLSYTGNLVPEQPVELALAAWADFVAGLPDGERNRVRFVYRGLSLERVRRAAGNLPSGATLDLAERVTRDETLRLMQRSQLLLLFSAHDSRPGSYLQRGLYPGKVFEYFGAQRPILCVPGDDGQLDALLAETRTGTIRSSREEITAFLAERFATWKRDGRLPYQPEASAVARYERRAQAGVLASILDEVAQAPRTRK
ncbi:MAG: glycosyltransferase [Myxococcota bacterium]|nr:glycosyltransferase [Myxococcota bacterium]